MGTYWNASLRELNSIANILEPLKSQNRVTGFITASADAGLIKEFSAKAERVLADYQVFSCSGYIVKFAQ
jgi:hypothetical protein